MWHSMCISLGKIWEIIGYDVAMRADLTSCGLPAPLSTVSMRPSEFLLRQRRPRLDPLDGSVTGCL